MDDRLKLTVTVPGHWANNIPLTVEDRLRIALVRLAGCPCRRPLLGYTGGNLTDGPRCRMCGCGVIFEEVETT